MGGYHHRTNYVEFTHFMTLLSLAGTGLNKCKKLQLKLAWPGKHWKWAAVAVTMLIASPGLTGAQTQTPAIQADAAAAPKPSENPPPRSDYFSALQGLLNADFPEYEIVFSIVDKTVRPQLPQAQTSQRATIGQIGSPNTDSGSAWHRTYERPGFYHLRRSHDGFVTQSGDSLEQVQRFSLTTDQTAQISGVCSNAWWQNGHGLLFMDNTRFSALKNHELAGAAKDLADEVEQDVLSLGLCIKRGSVLWNGTHFTAETGTHSSTPAGLRGRRIVTGHVNLSNGIPTDLDCGIFTAPVSAQLPSQDASAHFSIHLGYDPVISARFKIPTQMDVTRIVPKVATNHLEYRIFGLQAANFPSGSSSPALFAISNSSLSIIEKYSNGVGTQTRLVILTNKPQMEKYFSGEGMQAPGNSPAGLANPAMPDSNDNYAGFTTLPEGQRDAIVWELQAPPHNWWGLPEQKSICRDLLATQGYSSFANNASSWTFEAIDFAEKQGWKDLTPLIAKIYERPINIWMFARAFRYLRGQSGKSVSTNVISSFQVLRDAGNYQSSVSDKELSAAKERLLKEPDKEALLVYALDIAGWNSGKGGSQRGREAAADVLKSLDHNKVTQRLRQLRQDASPKGWEELFQPECDWIAQYLGIPLERIKP
jgi:hypothetical protein